MSGNDVLGYVRQALGWALWAAGVALGVMLIASVSARLGFPIRQVPSIAPMDLAALAVAWWAVPKG